MSEEAAGLGGYGGLGGGGLTSLYLTNPALAMALRKQQMAQGLIQEGTSAAPIGSRWQGVAHLAQSALGAFLMNKSNSDMQSEADRQKSDLADQLLRNQAPLPSQMQAPAAPPAASMTPDPTAGAANPLLGGGAPPPQDTTGGKLSNTGDLMGDVPGVQVAGPGAPTGGFPGAAPGATLANPDGTGAPPPAAPPPGAGPAPAPAPAAPPATGMNSPNMRDAAELMRRANETELRSPYSPIAKIQAAALRQQAQILMSTDTWHTMADGSQVNSRTGEVKSAATPSLNYSETSPGSGIYTSKGAKPEFAPVGANDRFIPLPNGQQLNTRTGKIESAPTVRSNYQETSPGSGIYADTTGGGAPHFQPPGRAIIGHDGKVYMATPSGLKLAADMKPEDVAAYNLAQEQGKKTGEQAALTPDKMIKLGHDSDTAIGNIDYGVNQLNQAAKNGLQSGYFAPWLGTAAAGAKYLGLDLSKLGIDPAAVGNVQSAQKTLGVVAGAILQGAIGKDSAITDAKIEHFIHTQPDIATDPQALQRVLGWARSQFQYSRDMAMDAMKSVDPKSGMISPGWQAGYYGKKGAFAPIYDPLSQEMKQPTGDGPGDMPKPPPEPAKPQFREGQTATGPDGAKQIFTGGKWQPIAAPTPAAAWPVGADQAKDPDGTTYDKGKYIKRGNRIVPNGAP